MKLDEDELTFKHKKKMVSLLRMMLFCIMYHLSFEFMVTQADIQCVRECVHSKTYQHPTRAAMTQPELVKRVPQPYCIH